MSDTTWWYVCRSAGLTAWVMLSMSLIWGALISGRILSGARLRRWFTEMHPFLATVGLGALVLHIVAAVADAQIGLRWLDSVIPFEAAWNPTGLAWGVVSLWALAIVELTSLARRHMARTVWHGIHLASYGAAWLMALHAAFAGTDVRRPAVGWAALGLVMVTTFLIVWRVLNRPPLGEPAPAGTAVGDAVPLSTRAWPAPQAPLTPRTPVGGQPPSASPERTHIDA